MYKGLWNEVGERDKRTEEFASLPVFKAPAQLAWCEEICKSDQNKPLIAPLNTLENKPNTIGRNEK